MAATHANLRCVEQTTGLDAEALAALRDQLNDLAARTRAAPETHWQAPVPVTPVGVAPAASAEDGGGLVGSSMVKVEPWPSPGDVHVTSPR